jgi:hypothetical protein
MYSFIFLADILICKFQNSDILILLIALIYIDWLIDYLPFYVPLKNILLIWRRHHCRWRAAKFRPMLGAQGFEKGGIFALIYTKLVSILTNLHLLTPYFIICTKRLTLWITIHQSMQKILVKTCAWNLSIIPLIVHCSNTPYM